MTMEPLINFPNDIRKNLRGVLCDIDDTVSTEGRLTARAYSAMERLRAAGLLVVPVTGRPAGWCDHIARMWPVDAVVGENGAFYFRYDHENHRMHQGYQDTAEVRAANRERLNVIAAEILEAVPGTGIASDQPYRTADIAIDFCEDVPPLGDDAVEKIVAVMEAAGMTAKVSSIHVNGWFGNYDKRTMTERLFTEQFDTNLDEVKDRFVYTGDSPNDQPMFAYFPYAVGVANLIKFVDQLTSPPAYITEAEAGNGFAELADFLLAD